MKSTNYVDVVSDRLTSWIGSTSSLILHTLFFLLSFLSHWVWGVPLDSVLLVLTTVVSLEAIYLNILIQRSVNQQAERLEDVEESLDDVEESLDDVEESLEDMEQALDEVEESLKDTEDDIEDIASDTAKQLEQPIERLMTQMKEVLEELNQMKNKNKK